MARAERYKLVSKPPFWVSIHRSIDWAFTLPLQPFFYFPNDGKIQVTVLSFDVLPVVGDRVFISGQTSISGYHIVADVLGTNSVVLDTPYPSVVVNATPLRLAHVDLPVVKVYSGYRLGDLVINGVDLSTLQPYTLVGEFIPQPDLNGIININLSGWAKAAIDAPYQYNFTGQSTDFNLTMVNGDVVKLSDYIRLQFYFNTGLKGENYCANSSLTASQLNRYYVNHNFISECGFVEVTNEKKTLIENYLIIEKS